MDECKWCGGPVTEIGCLDCFPQSEEEKRWDRIQEGCNEIGEPL